MNECVKEDPLNENDGVPGAADKKMKMKKLTKKKKEGGGLGMRWVGFTCLEAPPPPRLDMSTSTRKKNSNNGGH